MGELVVEVDVDESFVGKVGGGVGEEGGDVEGGVGCGDGGGLAVEGVDGPYAGVFVAVCSADDYDFGEGVVVWSGQGCRHGDWFGDVEGEDSACWWYRR